MSNQDDLLRRADQVLPGGLLGSHRSGPGLEFVVKEGRGAYLYDMAGRRYLDYLLGSGPMLLGHAHPAVVEAVERQMARGTSYFLLNEPAIELAEEIVKAVPCAEQVRYTSSGSEATFFALRVARAFRKREKIMKFEGGFHGTHDYALMSVVPRSPKAFPAPMMDSAGVPHAIEAEVLIAPYNDLATAEALIAAHHDELAAVLIEPYQRTIVPAPGFLAGLRAATKRYGVPLIFDEIVTGFRFAYGGAQEYYGVVPDLAAYGKVVAGGFPLACIAGPKPIMRHFDAALEGTADYVWQAGQGQEGGQEPLERSGGNNDSASDSASPGCGELASGCTGSQGPNAHTRSSHTHAVVRKGERVGNSLFPVVPCSKVFNFARLQRDKGLRAVVPSFQALFQVSGGRAPRSG